MTPDPDLVDAATAELARHCAVGGGIGYLRCACGWATQDWEADDVPGLYRHFAEVVLRVAEERRIA